MVSTQAKRRWEVSHGYYSDVVAYSGPNTWLAGLWVARCVRDHCHRLSTFSVWDLDSIDVDGDSRTDEESEFFNCCISAGEQRKSRKHKK